MILELLTIVSPVVICALIGFVWSKRGYTFDVDQITRLVTYIGTPALVFATLTNVEIDPDTFSRMAMATAVTVVMFAVIGAPILRIADLRLQPYLPPMVWANMGNMGLPLCLFAFGPEGLALAITYFAVNVVMMFTLGVAFSAGSFSIKQVLKLPFIYAVAAAVAVMLTDFDVPRWIGNTAELLGGLTIPLMLIMLGVSLASLKVTSLQRAVLLSALRLVMGFLVGVGVAWAFGFEGAERGVLILEAAMPVAVYNYLFAVKFDQEPGEVAGMIVISTALSFITLPALLWFVL
ncbi:MAG: AEC family transporter [Rhodospirillales bacterium]|nr:AEC family transporter [Rhodospirillales bacterium]MBT4039465.1 AEC family transporter [Rhodospirillales bacterium]MBT4627103.1 AEC family transporter [Rhodospirillales bacterium]MBT5352401.1 AEC family transporter [Rhodospirillales bacterium]MBT5520415.1 AEC family transporter [Rhodospirillales bacterium]